jgi:hypothetical protein
MKFLNSFLVFVLVFVSLQPLFPQVAPGTGGQDEILSFVGLKIDDLIMRFGIPTAVYAVRGGESWQDDVVFVYAEGDFYIYRDRVWQIGVKSACGIKVGDSKAVALLTAGDKAADEGGYMLCPLPGGGWPVSLRADFSAGKVSAIFIFRPDF